MSHEHYKNLIDTLYECASECIHCEMACLEEQDVKMLERCIRLDMECAETCIYSAKMLSMGTEFSSDIIALCSRICEECAEECEKHSQKMDHCRTCAEICRKCYEECRSMADVNVM
ncbi:MAG TPA: four-helix bundle copper-binding protein [Bacteroidales bacterium]|nr:four-helix bundle copper-binding protein [Bacteroidales bacterium]